MKLLLDRGQEGQYNCPHMYKMNTPLSERMRADSHALAFVCLGQEYWQVAVSCEVAVTC